jgi:hypothetical protein
MLRRVLAACLVCATAFGLLLAADDPAKAPPKKSDSAILEEAALQQERLRIQYGKFEQSLLTLAQRLERSSKPEDQARAKALKEAIQEASKVGINLKFDKLISTLRASKQADLQEIKEAMTQSDILAQDIRAILALLLSDNRDEQIKAEQEKIRKLMEMLDRVIRDQKVTRAQTESGRVGKENLSKSQKKVNEQTRDVAKAMDKSKESKDGKDGKDGKGKDGKDGKDSKDGKGEGKDSKDGKDGKDGKDSKDAKGKEGKDGKDSKDGKGEGKDSKNGKDGKDSKGKDGKQGKDSKGQGKDGKDGKDGQEGDQSDQNKQNNNQQQQQQEATPGKKQVQDAIEEQKRALENLEKDKKKDASGNQDEAIRKLEEARKELERLLKQLREEELERLLANLQRRVERMLQMQMAVLDETLRIDKAVNQNSDRKPNRTQEQESLKLSDREEQIVREANNTLQLLAEEGSAVAFAEVLGQVRDDMRTVARRLVRADVGHVTQEIEQSIIAMLKEMVEALKKKQQQMQDQKNQPPPPSGGQPPPQSLIDLIAELKMIRSMQVQVNNRTTTYGRQYQGEQASDAEIAKELGDLARRQQKLVEVTNNIAKGKNK